MRIPLKELLDFALDYSCEARHYEPFLLTKIQGERSGEMF
jgi:hypothetical protein